jgi:hypothetical protein
MRTWVCFASLCVHLHTLYLSASLRSHGACVFARVHLLAFAPGCVDALQKIVDRRSSKQKLTHFNLIFKSKFADLAINVGGKTAYAHTFMLRLRAPTMLEVLLGKHARLKKRKGRHFKLRIWTVEWSDSKILKRSKHYEPTHKLVLLGLEYLYSDEVNVHSLSPTVRV